jgi:hypothetical protein
LARSSGSSIALVIWRRASARRRQEPATAGHRRGAELHEGEDRGAVQALERREALEEPLRALGVGVVHLRDRPPRRALVDVDVLDDRLDGGHHLDGTAAGADHRHPPAGEVDVVAPSRGVERGALEAVQASDRRHRRHRELAAGGEEHVGLVRAGAGLQHPRGSLGVPACGLHLGGGADALQYPVASRDVLEIGLDLGLGGEAARPARVRGEGELVEVRRDVAGGTGVGVVVPDAADPFGALEHGDVVVAGAMQHRDGADAAEAPTDDGDRRRSAMAVLVGSAAHGAETRGAPPASRRGPCAQGPRRERDVSPG